LGQKEVLRMSEKESKRKVKNTIGIELPFGWCLVRGEVLRDLQQRCRTAEYEVKLRTIMINRLLAVKV